MCRVRGIEVPGFGTVRGSRAECDPDQDIAAGPVQRNVVAVAIRLRRKCVDRSLVQFSGARVRCEGFLRPSERFETVT